MAETAVYENAATLRVRARKAQAEALEPGEYSETAEILSAGRDPIVFAEFVLGIRLNPAQRRWFEILVSDGRWWNTYSAHVAANQTGKSLGCAILILWACIYKFGLSTEDREAWLNTPYHWFHVAPTQNQAYIALGDIELLVRGAHPAQVDECRFPSGLVNFEKTEIGYDGMVTPVGAVAQFRTTDEKAKALQGRRANGISFDECAFENHLIAVINETLSMRLIASGGPLILVSTPNGLNDYFEVVESIKEDATLVPNTDGKVWISPQGRAVVHSTVDDNRGYGLTAEEIERQERELAPGTKEQQLRGAFLEPSEAFFAPGDRILAAFKPNLSEAEEPIGGHRYIVFWDPSISYDPMAGYVLDTTRKPWRVVREVYERRPQGFSSLINQMFGLHGLYNSALDPLLGKSSALTGYDDTGMGGKIIGEQMAGIHPRKPIDFGGAGNKKLDVLTNLKAALLKGMIEIPDTFHGLKRELLNYRLADAKIANDRVVALAGAAWLASRHMGPQMAAFSVHAQVGHRGR